MHKVSKVSSNMLVITTVEVSHPVLQYVASQLAKYIAYTLHDT